MWHLRLWENLAIPQGSLGGADLQWEYFWLKQSQITKGSKRWWQSLLLRESIKQEFPASGRIWMDSYLQINCFIQINVTLFKTLHAILENPTKPSPHSTQSYHKLKAFCGTWLSICSLLPHNAAVKLAEGTQQIKRVFVVVKRQTLNFSN